MTTKEKALKRRREKRIRRLKEVLVLLIILSFIAGECFLILTYQEQKVFIKNLIQENSKLKSILQAKDEEILKLKAEKKELDSIHKEIQRLRQEVSRGKKRKISNKVSSTKKTSNTYSTPKISSPSYLRRLALKAITQVGLNSSEIDMLMWIIQRESDFRVGAVSSTGKYVGLGQLSSTQRARYNVQTGNAYSELLGMCEYIKSRYGSIRNAYNFWRSHHWY